MTFSMLVVCLSASSAMAFERNALAGTEGNVGGDEQAAGGVVDAPGQRLGAEPAEHDRMNAPERAQASMAMGNSGIIGR